VPPRRGPDTRPPPGPSTRINEAIRGESVRLIGADGTNVGVVSLRAALEMSAEQDLDLVEIAPDAQPPVCRIMDYGKWRYDQEQKAKQARKHQSTITIKEIKFRPKIDPHDYATKKGHVERLLKQRDKVKVTIMFRGRENLHPERGRDLLMRMAEDVKDVGLIESPPLLDGRNMIMVLGPTKTAGVVKSDAKGEDSERGEEAVQAQRSGEADAPPRDEEPQPREEVVEAEAGLP
jgi:translation initiation factor IF-3